MPVIVTRDGHRLSQRAWDLIADVERATGHDLTVVQGGYRNGDGASASAGTHDAGDVWDIARGTFTDAELTAIAVEFRRRNVCFWWRLRRYGWTSTGEHGHGVLRDSEAALSPGAQQQVRDYDAGLDGLAHSTAASRPFKGKDYHPRPVQRHWPFPTGLPVVKWVDLKNGSQTQIRLVADSFNRLGIDRYAVRLSTPPRFDDVKEQLLTFRVRTGSLTMRAALEKLSARTGRRWRAG